MGTSVPGPLKSAFPLTGLVVYTTNTTLSVSIDDAVCHGTQQVTWTVRKYWKHVIFSGQTQVVIGQNRRVYVWKASA